MTAFPHTLRRLSVAAAICLGGVAVAASTAAADNGCGQSGHRADFDDRDYDYDYDYDYDDRRASTPTTVPVRYDRANERRARQCRQASFDQREFFRRRLAQLQRTEARTVQNAYLPRTRVKAQRIAAQAREQARRLTTADRSRPWRSRTLACRDDVRRFRAATQGLDRSIDRLMRLAARDARIARRFHSPQRPVYTAPRDSRARPTRVVYR